MDDIVVKEAINKKVLKIFFDPLIKNKVSLYYPFYANTYIFKHHYGLVLEPNLEEVLLRKFDWSTNKELFDHIKKEGNDITVCFTNEEKYQNLENIANANDYSVEKIKFSSFFFKYIFLEKDSYVGQLYEKACELEGLVKNTNEKENIFSDINYVHPKFTKYIGQLIKKGYKSINLITDIPDEANSLLKKLFYEEYGLSYKLFINEHRKDSLKIYIKGGPDCSKILFDEKDKYICFEIGNDIKWTSTTFFAIIYHKKKIQKQEINDIKQMLTDYSNILFTTVKSLSNNDDLVKNTNNCITHQNKLCNGHDRSTCNAWRNENKYYCRFERNLFEGVNYLDANNKIIDIDSIIKTDKKKYRNDEEEHYIRCLFNHHLYDNDNSIVRNEIKSFKDEVTEVFKLSTKHILIKLSKFKKQGLELPDKQIRYLIVWKEIFENKLEKFETYFDSSNHDEIKKIYTKHLNVVLKIEDELNKSEINDELCSSDKAFLNIIHFALHLRYFADNYKIQEIEPDISINSIEMFFLYSITRQTILANVQPI